MNVVRWNDQGWVNTGAELRRWKKMDVPQFVRWRAKIVNQDLTKWTPPRGRNPGSESFSQQKKRGEKTLEADIHKVFQAVDQLGIWGSSINPKLTRNLRNAVNSGNTMAVRGILESIGIKVDSVFAIPYPSIHEAARTRRGRVKGVRWNWVFRGSSIKGYIRQRRPSIGKLKSGWGAGARFLGTSSPAWVSRHGANGRFENRLSVPDRPTIRLINDQKAAKDMSQIEIVDAALAINEKKMEKELKAILAHELKRHSRR
jgi:hypothetical protein